MTARPYLEQFGGFGMSVEYSGTHRHIRLWHWHVSDAVQALHFILAQADQGNLDFDLALTAL